MEKIIKRITSLVLVFGLTVTSICGGININGVTPEVKKSQAAEDEGKYLKELKISHAQSREEAQAELGDEYTLMSTNFGQKNNGFTWIGYTTTDNPEYAIRDIKVESMSGDYSISDYEELLKNHKAEIQSDIDTFVPALIEFTKNYDNDLDAAKIVKRSLDYYYEDDSDKALGEFVLDIGRRLSNNAQDASAMDELKKIFTQGNTAIIQLMLDMITQGSDPRVEKKGSWLTRMSDLGMDGLINAYKQTNPKIKTNRAAINEMAKDLKNDAEAILKELPDMQKYFRDCEKTELVQAIEAGDTGKADKAVSEVADKDIGTEPTADSTIDEMAESMGKAIGNTPDTADLLDQSSMAVLLALLKETPYGDETMYDFFTREDLTKEDLYPMAYVLSNGQKTMIGETGLYGIFVGAAAEYAEETEETNQVFEELGEKVYSVYTGVDRNVFNGDTAITVDALKKMASDDDNEAVASTYSVTDYLLVLGSPVVGAICLRNFLFELTIPHYKKVVLKGAQTQAYKNADALVRTLQKELTMVRTNDIAMKLKILEQNQFIKGFKANLGSVGEAIQQFNSIKGQITKNGIYAEGTGFTSSSSKAVVAKQNAKLNQAMIDRANLRTAKEFKTVKAPRVGMRIAYALGALVAFAFVGYEIYNMVKKSGVEFTEIPGVMVSRTYEGNEVSYIAYTVVRTAGNEKADIYNEKGKEWLALYITRDENVGEPILARDFGVRESATDPDSDLVSVVEFGKSNAYDVTGEHGYLYYRKNDTSVWNTTASAFGGEKMIWIALVILLLAVLAALAGLYVSKRKKS